jgi:hypothetical protein
MRLTSKAIVQLHRRIDQLPVLEPQTVRSFSVLAHTLFRQVYANAPAHRRLEASRRGQHYDTIWSIVHARSLRASSRRATAHGRALTLVKRG